MTAGHVRAGLISLMLVGMGSEAFALEADKWSLVQNKGSRALTVELTQFPDPIGKSCPSTGQLYIRKAGESGDGELIDAGNSYILKKGTDYEFYFLTTMVGACIQTFKLSDHTVFVAKLPAGVTSEAVLVGTKCKGKSAESPLVFNVAGFRNTKAGAFMTIKDM